ncbi:hypothetical protein [Robertmurraya sp. FSL R5-0851]|uniref:hypothetical protein n=1 Tax=Robertmurraya sp. FSL R5-0851 TaxID=2921584 RepID=UPI0030FCDBEF
METNENKGKDYIPLLLPFKSKVTTTKEWDSFVKEQEPSLPSASILIYRYGTWNDVKRLLGVKVKTPYSRVEIEKIIKKYRKHMLSRNVWDKFAKNHELPTSRAIIEVFDGKWSEAKAFVNVHTELKRTPDYNKEDIKKVLLEHGDKYENQRQWNKFASENKLPNYNTIKTHFTYDEMMKIINRPKATKTLSNEELISLALEHKQMFFHSSMTRWDEYAKEKELPKSNTYHKRFGSWKIAKIEVTKSQMKMGK